MTSPAPAKPVRIAIIGIVGLLPDGSLSRSGALALELAAHANVTVTLRAIAPDAASCATIVDLLTAHGVASQVETRADGDETPIRLGDTLDIWGLFAHDLVILDADDAPLRAWLTDLPAHTAPGVRILGTMDYVTETFVPQKRERDIALRFDAIVGTSAQAGHLFALPDASDAADTAEAIGAMMRGANLRTAAIHEGATLAIAALDEPMTSLPLPSGSSREQIITAVAIAMARRVPWSSVADLLLS